MPYEADFLARLGLDSSADERAIRRAYARLLKQIDQQTQAERFQELRDDYEAALAWLAWRDDGAGSDHDEDGDQPDSPGDAHHGTAGHRHGNVAPVRAPILGVDTVQLADEVFNQFLDDVSQPRPTGLAYKDALAALKRCVDDQRLLNIAASTGFEARIAAFLAGGYHADHEVLFNAARQAFEWTADRHRLERLGYAGEVLNRALDERAMFSAQNAMQRTAQRQVLQALRKPGLPKARDLHGHMPHLRTLLTRFPVLMSLIADEQALERWRAAYALIEGEPTESNGTFGWICGVILLLFLFYNAVESTTFQRPPASANTEHSLDDDAAPTKAAEPADPNEGEPLKRAQLDEIFSHVVYRINNEDRREMREAGYAVHLDEAGWIKSLSILTSSGSKRYDDAVRKAIWASTPFAASTGRDFHLVFSMRIDPDVSSDAFGFTTVPSAGLAPAGSGMQAFEGMHSKRLPAPPMPTIMRAPASPSA